MLMPLKTRKSGIALSLLLFAVLLVVVPSQTLAQTQNGAILGTIKDSSGLVVPQAKVTTQDHVNLAIRTVVSGADGSYLFDLVPAGRPLQHHRRRRSGLQDVQR